MYFDNYYVSTGAKNAMYTLRLHKQTKTVIPYPIDVYLCNLSTDAELAAKKAKEYVELIKARIGESETHKINLFEYAGYELSERRGKLSVKHTRQLNIIEDGFFPYGKNVGKSFTEVEDNYILYFADKLNSVEAQDDVIFSALCSACMGEALNRDLFVKREEQKEQKRNENMKSNHFGNIGERIKINGIISSSFTKMGDYGMYFVTNIKVGSDILEYIGTSDIGKSGESVNLVATVKEHTEYQDIKKTKIARPKIVV